MERIMIFAHRGFEPHPGPPLKIKGEGCIPTAIPSTSLPLLAFFKPLPGPLPLKLRGGGSLWKTLIFSILFD